MKSIKVISCVAILFLGAACGGDGTPTQATQTTIVLGYSIKPFSDLKEAKLAGTDLSSTFLVGADLTGADLTGTDLSNAELIFTSLIDANLINANLTGTNLSFTDGRNANFTGAIMVGANLVGADLRGAKLALANLTNAQMTRVNLVAVYLTNAFLTGANLISANLANTELVSADPQVAWDCHGTPINGADGTAIGTGELNTADIVTGCPTTGIAAKVADAYSNNTLDDWFLPSLDELNALCNWAYVDAVGAFCNENGAGSLSLTYGGFSAGGYWSSSELDGYNAWSKYFNSGQSAFTDKYVNLFVRPIRSM